MASENSSSSSDTVVELNVGGITYATTLATLQQADIESPLAGIDSHYQHSSSSQRHSPSSPFTRDAKNRLFIDRDGVLFRYVLDYLRNKRLALPENFQERERLRAEADFYRLKGMSQALLSQMMAQVASPNVALQQRLAIGSKNSSDNLTSAAASAASVPLNESTSSFSGGVRPRSQSGYIVVGYRGTFAFGRDGLADVKFRKISRILICGRVHLCREVFGDTLNESRDPDHGQTDRYTSRFFLKHTFLEQAFDMLSEASFVMVGCAASGCSASTTEQGKQTDNEENRWLHYNEFVFYRM